MWVHSVAAAATVAIALVAGATRFDGIYSGTASVITPNAFCAGPPVPMYLAISNGQFIRQYDIPSPSSSLSDPIQRLVVPIAADGRFQGTMNVLVGHMTWVSIRLHGQITGSELTADEEWPLCSFRWSLTKVPAST